MTLVIKSRHNSAFDFRSLFNYLPEHVDGDDDGSRVTCFPPRQIVQHGDRQRDLDSPLDERVRGLWVSNLVVRKRHHLRFHAAKIFQMYLGSKWKGCGLKSRNHMSGDLHAAIRQRDQSSRGGAECSQPLAFSILLSSLASVFSRLGSLSPLTFRSCDRESGTDGRQPPNGLRPGGNAIVDVHRVQKLRSEAAKLKVQMRLPGLIAASSTLKYGLAQLLGAIALLMAAPALADPCKAIPDRGPLPPYLSRGATFSGPVTYVGDGDSLCVAVGQGQTNWVEVRVADFYAPELNAPGGREAKAALERITRGKRAVCTAGHRSYDRIVASCRIGGVSIGELMRSQGISEGGNGR